MFYWPLPCGRTLLRFRTTRGSPHTHQRLAARLLAASGVDYREWVRFVARLFAVLFMVGLVALYLMASLRA